MFLPKALGVCLACWLLTLTVDLKSGEPADRVDLLTRARGAEFGVRTVRLKGLQSTVALWYLGFDSELLFIGDAGGTEASRPSDGMVSSGPITCG